MKESVGKLLCRFRFGFYAGYVTFMAGQSTYR